MFLKIKELCSVDSMTKLNEGTWVNEVGFALTPLGAD